MNAFNIADYQTMSECPICLRHYADVDPTTLNCGHSCCLEDAKKLLKCVVCGVKVNDRNKLMVNYQMRDMAIVLRRVETLQVTKMAISEVENNESVESDPKPTITIESIECESSNVSTTIAVNTESATVKKRSKKKKKNKSQTMKYTGDALADVFEKFIHKGSDETFSIFETASLHNSVAVGYKEVMCMMWGTKEVLTSVDTASRCSCIKYLLFCQGMLLLSKGHEEGEDYLKQSADQGYNMAMYCYAERIRSHDVRECFRWMLRAANTGLAIAQLEVSQRCADGVGTSVNKAQSLRYLKQAADQDYIEAHKSLMQLYAEGDTYDEEMAAYHSGKIEELMNDVKGFEVINVIERIRVCMSVYSSSEVNPVKG